MDRISLGIGVNERRGDEAGRTVKFGTNINVNEWVLVAGKGRYFMNYNRQK
jgi:hypothetical protein